ncbi:hypothetical protein RZS28_17920 [Methylocapsa polymorpha]|uniref:Uncharacterized protein n=1 Tax=Methylocapsa polymorpha TaxID=3080828 RepID=A0ABZ0HRT5_9HYPH|nr:hypothetical protein RZS28_17920 [Methylocapsa sp. RX1]
MNLEKGEEVVLTKLPSGKWAPHLRLNGFEEPFSLGREFKTEEMAEGWLDTTEANNLIDQFITKYRKA